MTTMDASKFLTKHEEKADFNQYWYSSATIQVLCQEVEHAVASSSGRVAFLSTPSLFFSLPEGSAVSQNSWLFDYDRQWQSQPRFVCYNYKEPEAFPAELAGTFDLVVIDPPFITEEVWRLYAATAKLLLKPGGKVLTSTVAENAPLMDELFGASPCTFQPSIPHLVYQYNLYANYPTTHLAVLNQEIP